MTDAQIAESMGRCREFIGQKRREMGISAGHSIASIGMMARINRRRMARA
jgi:hypothetical protein